MSISSIRTETMSMRYFRFGNPEGTPFVILPGVALKSVMESAEAIKAQYRKLSAKYCIYVLDRRTDMPDPYSVSAMAEDTAEALGALSLRNAVLYGVSQGGMIAQLIAARHPELVGKLVVCSAAASIPVQAAAVFAEWERLAERNAVRELIMSFGENVYSPAYFRQYKDAFLAFGETVTDEDLRRFGITVSGFGHLDLREEAARIQCPVLVIGADADKIFGRAAAEEIALLTGGMLRIYPGEAHGVYDENADVLSGIEQFIEE